MDNACNACYLEDLARTTKPNMHCCSGPPQGPPRENEAAKRCFALGETEFMLSKTLRKRKIGPPKTTPHALHARWNQPAVTEVRPGCWKPVNVNSGLKVK